MCAVNPPATARSGTSGTYWSPMAMVFAHHLIVNPDTEEDGMKKARHLIYFCCTLLFSLTATELFAEDNKDKTRVIEDEIVLADPTVAKPKHMLVGGSGEIWYVWKNWIRWDNNKEYNHGLIKGFEPGGTLYVGYDKFTLSYTFRRGNWDGDSDTASVAGSSAKLSQQQTEHEIAGRWLFSTQNKHINPYLLAGYNYTNRKDVMKVDAAHPFSYNANTTSRSERTYNAPFLGTGLIVPFNDRFGVRGDLRLMALFADWKRDDGATDSKTDLGGAAVGTLYANIWKGLNAQMGWKYQRFGIKEGGELGATSKTGGFLMLGYTHKFNL